MGFVGRVRGLRPRLIWIAPTGLTEGQTFCGHRAKGGAPGATRSIEMGHARKVRASGTGANRFYVWAGASGKWPYLGVGPTCPQRQA